MEASGFITELVTDRTRSSRNNNSHVLLLCHSKSSLMKICLGVQIMQGLVTCNIDQFRDVQLIRRILVSSKRPIYFSVFCVFMSVVSWAFQN